MFQVNNVSINFDIVDVDENELSTLKTLIEENGGVVIKSRDIRIKFTNRNTFRGNECSCKDSINVTPLVYDIQYIKDCISGERLLDARKYRLNPLEYEDEFIMENYLHNASKRQSSQSRSPSIGKSLDNTSASEEEEYWERLKIARAKKTDILRQTSAKNKSSEGCAQTPTSNHEISDDENRVAGLKDLANDNNSRQTEPPIRLIYFSDSDDSDQIMKKRKLCSPSKRSAKSAEADTTSKSRNKKSKESSNSKKDMANEPTTDHANSKRTHKKYRDVHTSVTFSDKSSKGKQKVLGNPDKVHKRSRSPTGMSAEADTTSRPRNIQMKKSSHRESRVENFEQKRRGLTDLDSSDCEVLIPQKHKKHLLIQRSTLKDSDSNNTDESEKIHSRRESQHSGRKKMNKPRTTMDTWEIIKKQCAAANADFYSATAGPSGINSGDDQDTNDKFASDFLRSQSYKKSVKKKRKQSSQEQKTYTRTKSSTLSDSDSNDTDESQQIQPRCESQDSDHEKIDKSNRVVFSGTERTKMIKYIVKNNCIERSKGLEVWKEMIKSGKSNRTALSLQNHYVKSILPCIEQFNLPKNVLDRFIIYRDIKRKSRKT